jgi:hypothetical protein
MKGKVAHVPLRSEPPGASVTVVGSKDGHTVRGETPTVFLLRHGQDYAATFEKPGFAPRSLRIAGSVSGWYVLNILGLWGFLIDSATTLSGEPVEVRLVNEASRPGEPPRSGPWPPEGRVSKSPNQGAAQK